MRITRIDELIAALWVIPDTMTHSGKTFDASIREIVSQFIEPEPEPTNTEALAAVERVARHHRSEAGLANAFDNTVELTAHNAALADCGLARAALTRPVSRGNAIYLWEAMQGELGQNFPGAGDIICRIIRKYVVALPEHQPCATVREIVAAHLREHGFDGLVNLDAVCYCSMGDLIRCNGDYNMDCQPARCKDGKWTPAATEDAVSPEKACRNCAFQNASLDRCDRPGQMPGNHFMEPDDYCDRYVASDRESGWHAKEDGDA